MFVMCIFPTRFYDLFVFYQLLRLYRTRNLKPEFSKELENFKELQYIVPEAFKKKHLGTIIYPEEFRGIITKIEVFVPTSEGTGSLDLFEVKEDVYGDVLITLQLLSNENHYLVTQLKYLRHD